MQLTGSALMEHFPWNRFNLGLQNIEGHYINSKKMDNIVLDTNCLVSSLSRNSRYYPVWKSFIEGNYVLCVTDEILNEYQEIITQLTGSSEIANNVVLAILNRSNCRHLTVYYRFNLITADLDDNKFVDCAIKANARCIVSNDHHFKELETIQFPRVDVVGLEQFLLEITKISDK